MLLSMLALLMVTPPAETEHFATGTGFVIVWRSHALAGATHAGVERAFIMVHGAGRNAEDYFRWALASATVAGQLSKTVVIAPHFKSRSAGDPVEFGELEWSGSGWVSGEHAVSGKATSYDVIDQVLEVLNSQEHFPDLKEVVVAGHSAGGQLVQRYAAVNRMEPRMHVPVRYVAANPSSYLYLNDLRMQLGAACGTDGRCTGKFVKYWDAANCTTYNRYRYGLEARTGYAAASSNEYILEQYPRRNVTYIVGALDTRTDDSTLDRSCRAIAEGANRKERGLIYYSYIKTQFNATHTLEIAPGCGHSAVCVFAGPAGVKAVFGGTD